METPGNRGDESQGRPCCSRHPESAAVARCVNCGHFACPVCRVLLGGRNYCVDCAAQHLTAYPPGAAYRPPARPARPEVFPGAPWGVGEALIIFFLSMAIAAAFSVAIFYLFLRQIASPTTAIILLLFTSSCMLYALLLAGTFYSVKYRHRSTPSALGLRLQGLGKGFAWGVGLGVPLFVVAMGLAYLSQKVIEPTRVDYVSRALDRTSSGGVSVPLIVILVFTLVVLAPVCEEIFFRGYLYPALRNRMNMQPAMILNSMIFAAVHFELIGFLPRLVLAYGLCYLYEKNRTIAAPIVGHALYNGLIVMFAILSIF
ncbi:MAG: CPBP family intramembrane metalloprotease [Actinobacteria bacterium]|nr:CPBP family intramembrane metalloprotease [Actinomycetota bacterium]